MLFVAVLQVQKSLGMHGRTW